MYFQCIIFGVNNICHLFIFIVYFFHLFQTYLQTHKNGDGSEILGFLWISLIKFEELTTSLHFTMNKVIRIYPEFPIF